MTTATTTTEPTVLSTVQQAMRDYQAWIDGGQVGPVPHFYDVPRRRRAAATAKKARGTVPAPRLRLPGTAVTLPNGTPYVPRFWGEHPDIAVLQKMRAAAGAVGVQDLFPVLYGPPGTGKTVVPLAAFQNEIIVMQLSGDTETSDLLGQWSELPDGSVVWVDGPLVRAMEEGKVLFLDEVAIASPTVLTPVYSAMDGQRTITIPANPSRGTITAKEGFYVVGAFNPDAPGARVSEALMSRFKVHIYVDTDYGILAKMGVHKQVVTIARNMERKRVNGSVSWAPQMRECLAFRDTETLLGFDFAMENLISVCPVDDRGTFMSLVKRTLGQDGEKYTALSAGKQWAPEAEAEEAEEAEVEAE